MILTIIAIVTFGSTIANYWFIEDRSIQFRVCYTALAADLFFFSLMVLLNRIDKKNYKYSFILSFWLCVFFLDNFIGTLAGFNLNTKPFMYSLFLITLACIFNLIVKRKG